MRLAWLLASSHLRRRPLQNVLTLGGIAVGIMVLITALSLTNGFTAALIESTLRASPHLIVSSNTPVPPDLTLETQIKHNAKVEAFTPYVMDKGLLTRPARSYQAAGVDFATLFGIHASGADVLGLSELESDMLRTLSGNEIMLGAALARQLGAFTGDEIQLLSSHMKRKQWKIKGLFHTGNYLIDSAYAFVNMATLQEHLSSPVVSTRILPASLFPATREANTINGYYIRLKNPDQAPLVGRELTLGRTYIALPWQHVYGNLLEQMQLQKKVIAFVVFLIVIVAAFGIANVLTLIVFEKSKEIAILRAIGATQSVIVSIFMLEGVLLGIGGILLGNILGISLSYYFVLYPFKIPGDLYFITSLPVQIKWTDILWVNAVALVTTLIAAWLPAQRAARLEPARIIR